MTIKQVADKTELREATVSHAENGKSIEIATIKKLSIILEQPIWWLGCFENLPSETLAQRIRKCRLYHGFTKRQFADKLGINEKTVRLWEDQISEPSVESLKLLQPYFSIIEHSTHPQSFLLT